VLLAWWAEENRKRRHLWPGINVGRDTTGLETVNQIMISRAMLPEGPGNVHWSIGPLQRNERLGEALLQGPYQQQALVPPTPWRDKKAPAAPVLTTSAAEDSLHLRWSHPAEADVFHWVVYYEQEGAARYRILNRQARSYGIPLFRMEEEALADTDSVRMIQQPAPVTRLAITAVDRLGNESPRSWLSFD
jgi:hypothetical protein